MQQPNPFLIDIEDKNEYTLEEYEEIQKKLDKKKEEIVSLVDEMYSDEKNNFYKINEFYRRCLRGVRQNVCNVEKNWIPTTRLITIGDGDKGTRDHCFVCCTAFTNEQVYNEEPSNTRFLASQNIQKSLEEVGYNGHLLLMNGGFPNPTGKEMKYAGVPYCFKIFLMLEAEKLGFKRVIWIDSGCFAVNNPMHLFDVLKERHTLFRHLPDNRISSVVLQKTADILDELTGGDIHRAHFVVSIVMGLNLENPKIQQWIKEYYDMVENGWTFFSYYPEEIVFTALFQKPEYREFVHDAHENYMLQIHETYASMEHAKRVGYYFVHRHYSAV
jgi:hypothetical protein